MTRSRSVDDNEIDGRVEKGADALPFRVRALLSMFRATSLSALRRSRIASGNQRSNSRRKHDRCCNHVHELWNNQKAWLSEHRDNRCRKESVLCSEIETEIEIFDNVSDGVDTDNNEKQPGGPERLRVFIVGDGDSTEHREPYRNNHPVDQRGCETHVRTRTLRRACTTHQKVGRPSANVPGVSKLKNDESAKFVMNLTGS